MSAITKIAVFIFLARNEIIKVILISMSAITKITVFIFLALVLPWLSLLILPTPDIDLIDNLYEHIGPTMPFLIAFSAYAIAGLWLVAFIVSNSRDASEVLNHTEKISEWIIPIGMIGTYYALSEVLGLESADFSAHMHAMYSTLIALVIYVVVGIGSEFIKRARHYPVDGAMGSSAQETASDNYLILKQIEITGCVIGVCAFIYYLMVGVIFASS